MEKKMVVLYPGVGVGHLSPMLELSKGLLRHGRGAVDVAVVLVESPFGDPGFADTVARAKASNTSVAFHVLPSPPAPASVPGGEQQQEEHPVVGMLRFLRATEEPLRDFLRALSASRPVRAVVLDMFCAHALDVAADLGLPAYFFISSGAAALCVFMGLPSKRASLGTDFEELGDAAVSFAGAPPVKASELPTGTLCESALGLASRMPDARGILVNSFEALEPRAVRALRDGLCVPDRPTPPVHCVGPLVSPGGAVGKEEHECLRWMDTQPDRSVVFLCFGSMGTFPKSQLHEIAVGLEKSGQRFLWVVRSPPGVGEAPSDDDLDALLPAGFKERTKDRGFVVRSWAPQVDVLRHRAAGAFVTHCGWNSTLEGVTAGLPLLCWPLYAEQKINKLVIVEDMGLGMEMAMDDDEGVVKAEEVEAKVRWVMEDSDDDGARALRERVAAARDRAAEAIADGGPSDVAFVDFLSDLLEASHHAMANV